jgi:VWFA-related protein
VIQVIKEANQSRRPSLLSVSAASFLLVSCSLWSQTPAPGSTAPQSNVQEPSVRFKKTIRLVEVDVIAKDKKGQPVTGLEAKDFRLRDNGRAETITLFSIQNRSDQAEEKAGKEPEGTPSLSNSIRVFSNSHPASSAPVVILMDLLNTSSDNQPAMKSALLASLQHIPPQMPVALLILGDDLKVVSDFTTDTNSLTALLEKPSVARQEGSGPAITAPKTSNKKFNDVILKTAVRAFNQETGDQLTRTMRALDLIRDQLRHMHGRKSLIWIGGGLSVSPHDWTAVRGVIDQLNDANLAVYTVDARGVVLDYGIGADVDAQDLLGPRREEQAETRGDILDVVARSTGGVPYRNTNALDQVIARAIDDSNTVYTLGYYPQHGDWQGKPHKIEVKVARAGVSLRYRSGYIATPEAKPEAANQPQMLDAIAASPLDFPGLRFSVEEKPGNDRGTQSLTVHVPLGELRLSLQDDKSVGAIQLWFIQKQSSGDDLTRKTSTFGFQLTPREYQDAVAHGLTLASVLKLNKTTAKVRVLLRDNNSGRVGTVDVPVTPVTKPAQLH